MQQESLAIPFDLIQWLQGRMRPDVPGTTEDAATANKHEDLQKGVVFICSWFLCIARTVRLAVCAVRGLC